MLNIIVERSIHILYFTQSQGHAGNPVVVVRMPDSLREWEDVFQQLTPKHGGRSGNRVRQYERGEISVVVRSGSPIRAGDEGSLAIDDVHVGVNQCRLFGELRKQGRNLVRVPNVILV